MSIVNDALKKAGKNFEFNEQGKTVLIKDAAAPSSDKKWIAIIMVSLFIIASLFGSLILYKSMFKSSSGYAGNGLAGPGYAVQSTLNSIERKNLARDLRPQDIVKLNGIVCGTEGKWALVNDRIVKEGDSILGGEIISITKDVVKILKRDGSELTLSLK